MSLVVDAIEWIRLRDHVSMAELRDWLSEHDVNPIGRLGFGFVDKNIYLWVGSEAMADFVEELRPWVDIEPAHILVYVADGGMLNMPICKRIPKNGYKEPHWLPITMRAKEKNLPASVWVHPEARA